MWLGLQDPETLDLVYSATYSPVMTIPSKLLRPLIMMNDESLHMHVDVYDFCLVINSSLHSIYSTKSEVLT